MDTLSLKPHWLYLPIQQTHTSFPDEAVRQHKKQNKAKQKTNAVTPHTSVVPMVGRCRKAGNAESQALTGVIAAHSCPLTTHVQKQMRLEVRRLGEEERVEGD